MQRDYQVHIDQAIAELQQEFPNSSFIDDLLIANYFLTRERKYLQINIPKAIAIWKLSSY